MKDFQSICENSHPPQNQSRPDGIESLSSRNNKLNYSVSLNDWILRMFEVSAGNEFFSKLFIFAFSEILRIKAVWQTPEIASLWKFVLMIREHNCLPLLDSTRHMRSGNAVFCWLFSVDSYQGDRLLVVKQSYFKCPTAVTSLAWSSAGFFLHTKTNLLAIRSIRYRP